MDSKQQSSSKQENVEKSDDIIQSPERSEEPTCNVAATGTENGSILPKAYRKPKSISSSDSSDSTIVVGRKRKATQNLSNPVYKRLRMDINNNFIMKPQVEIKEVETTAACNDILAQILEQVPELTLGEKIDWYMNQVQKENKD